MNEPGEDKNTGDHGEEESKKQSRGKKILKKVGSLSSKTLTPVKYIASQSKRLLIAPKKKPGDDNSERQSLALEDLLERAKVGKGRLRELCKELDDDDDNKRHSVAFEDLLSSANIDKAALRELCKELDLTDSKYDGLDMLDEDDGYDDDRW
jgi:hypothetical protein